jgi:NADP-reducing hydrogenase subunit HndD
MEAALRTAAEWITGDTAAPVEFTDVRGTEDIKEATYKVGDLTLNVAVTSGLKNAEKLLESVRSGEKNYHFIEVMACPGGCVNGGGQPIQPAKVRNNVDLKKLRAKALYSQDSSMPLRKSHDNPVIKEVYDKYLEKPGSHRAHELLHTSYVAKDKFTGE